MFVTPPPPLRTMKTRSALLREQSEQQASKDVKQSREVQSENLKCTKTEPSLPENKLAKNGSLSVKQPIKKSLSASKKSSKSSIVARRLQLELEAAEAKAKIDEELIQKRLDAEIAALEDESNKSYKSHSEISVNGKVEHWLKSNAPHSHLDVPEQLPHTSGQLLVATPAAPTDIQLLACALKDALTTAATDGHNRELLTRISTSKDLPLFFGDPLEWLQFREAFHESTKLCKFSENENIWRLRKCLRGEARETVSSLLIGNTTPQIILDALELRYGRPETIINKIIYQIKKIPPLSHNYHNDIISFAIKIKNFVAAAQTIKQVDYLRSPELVSTVLTKCPSILLYKWADYYNLNCNLEKAKLEILADFLYEEANKISAAGLSHIHQSHIHQPDYKRRSDDRKSHSVLLGDKQDVTNICKFCRRSKHDLPECSRFKRAMTKDRWRFVRTSKLCHKCLLASHDRDTCTVATCNVDECGLPHHHLLHWKKPPVSAPAPINNNILQGDNIVPNDNRVPNDYSTSRETMTNVNISSNKSSVLLKVVPINIHGPRGIICTHALLDDGATVSLISADIADQLDLHGHKQTLCVRGAWNSELMCESEILNCIITNMNNEPFELSVRKISELNLPVQKLPSINLDDYNNKNNLNSFTSYRENVQPKLLIGQDNYHLITPLKTIIRGKNEPCATLTPLGWCIHGKYPTPTKCNQVSRSPESAMITVVPRKLPSSPAVSCACSHATLFDTLLTTTHARIQNKQKVSLPWKSTQLESSYNNAYCRLKAVKRKKPTDEKYVSRYKKRVSREEVLASSRNELTSRSLTRLPCQKWYQKGRNLKPGDVVVITDPNLPRNTWPKGLVEKVYPGKDGRIRTVDLKTKSGILTRPVTRLATLPMTDECL